MSLIGACETLLNCNALHCTGFYCTPLHFTFINCTLLHWHKQPWLEFTFQHYTATYSQLNCSAPHCTALLCTVPYCTALPSALFTKQPAWGVEYQGYHGLWYSEQILTMYITTKGTSTLEWCYYIHQTIGRMEYLSNHGLQYPGQKSWEKWCSVPICCLFPLDAVLSSGLCDMLNRLTNYLMLGFLLFLFWSKGNQEKRLYR